jgi:hypothetical protein
MIYTELVAALPLPTVEQTASFAGHVAENHSWYKHLPVFPPGATFVFFLNPHAGEEVERDGDGYVTRSVETGDYFRHHSRYSTPDYLRQFGHWDYWVDNPLAVTRSEGPLLYGTGEGGRAPLPGELARRWSCRLTAFLRNGRGASAEEVAAFREYARANPDDPDVERYEALARERPDASFSWHREPGAFHSREQHVQRQLVLQAVFCAREDCARMRRAGA